MSPPSGRESRHLHQQHKLAKDLIRAARAGDAPAIARLSAAFPGRSRFRLADAQLVIARDAGFDSWTRLVRHIEQVELSAAAAALHRGDADELRRLLVGSEHLRSKINAPLFDFGRRAIHVAAKKPAVIDVLLEFGADLNAASNWDKGAYVPLDDATEESARHLIARGARLTPNVAARLGWIDDLRALLDHDAALVHVRGGDGRTPLHEAANSDVADLLIDRGADLNVRCIDHHSTPAQYALVERPGVCRRLLDRGAEGDLFVAAKLNDADLARRVLADTPGAADARVGFEGYTAVPPVTIYCWTLGWYKSSLTVAHESGSGETAAIIAAKAHPRTILIDALLFDFPADVDRLLAEHPPVMKSLTRREHGLLAHAAHLRQDEAAGRMLALGFDPTAPGIDGGTALHQAAWTGAADLVALLLSSRRWDLEARDPTHGSTVLGWAAHGSVHCRHPRGDYEQTVRMLIEAGAKTDVAANASGTSMADQATGNPAVQELLRDSRTKS